MRKLLLFTLTAALLTSAAEVPTGTPLMIRLTAKVDSSTAKPKDPVEAVLISPVVVDGQVVVPTGTLVHGRVATVQTAAKSEDGRASMSIVFTQLQEAGKASAAVKLDARLTEVDNARESVDDTGRIVGIKASETLTSRMDSGIRKLGERFGELAGILQAVKGSMLNEANPEITYEPGVEMSLMLTKPLQFVAHSAGPALVPVPDEQGLVSLLNIQPFQTYAARPPRPSDITNLMFVGSAAALTRAFTQAGWVAPQALGSESKMETFKAIAEMRGYKEGPFSLLVLDGAAPSYEFQKANNTFAKRHHLRIWQRPGTYAGKPIWVCSATHDIGIDFSEHDRTFIHLIDPEIDRERAKVVTDLLYTGHVKSLELVGRPKVPLEGLFNATGDPLHTDGQMAVVILE